MRDRHDIYGVRVRRPALAVGSAHAHEAEAARPPDRLVRLYGRRADRGLDIFTGRPHPAPERGPCLACGHPRERRRSARGLCERCYRRFHYQTKTGLPCAVCGRRVPTGEAVCPVCWPKGGGREDIVEFEARMIGPVNRAAKKGRKA